MGNSIFSFLFVYHDVFVFPLLLYRIESKHEVTILNGLNEFCVKFYGPRGSKWFLYMCMSSVFFLYRFLYSITISVSFLMKLP